jgi:hypothetical protein
MRRTRLILFSAVACAISFLGNVVTAYSSEKRVLGWVEKVQILPENLILNAKLDTGANTTSVDASRITEFERNGRPWIRFSISDRSGNTGMFERPLVRVVRVRRSDSPTTSRPVVMLAICVGSKFREEAVTLTNRSHLRHPVLLGRSAMEGRIIVNPSRKFTFKPDCTGR